MAVEASGLSSTEPVVSQKKIWGISVQGWLWALIPLALVIVAVYAIDALGRDRPEKGAISAMVLAALLASGLVGALVVSPGTASGDAGTAESNKLGWGNRLGVFGTWLTGAALALLVTNGSKVAGWFADMTASVASGGTNKRGDVLMQYGLAALLISAVAGGFLFGALQMGTNGRIVLAAAAKASKDAEASALVAQEAAAKATEAAGLAGATPTLDTTELADVTDSARASPVTARR